MRTRIEFGKHEIALRNCDTPLLLVILPNDRTLWDIEMT